MKKFVPIIALSLLIVGACSKKESPVEQREKTERTIHKVVDRGEQISNSRAAKAYESMPDNAPIESSMPHGVTGKSTLASEIAHLVPIFTKNVKKSPVDSITGTWEFDETTGEWNHISGEPSDGIVLLWNYKDSTGTSHRVKAEFLSLGWYNDSLLTRTNMNLYVDDEKVAYFNYELSLDNDGIPVGVSMDGAIVGEVEFSLSIQAAEGHNLNETNFYGTVHVSFSDVSGVSYALDMTVNEDGSSSFRFTYRENDESWEVYWAMSAPDENGAQSVSGYIKDNGTKVASIEGTINNGDFSGVYVVYNDGTRVSVSEYLAGVDVGPDSGF